jgi:putative redox protein
MIHDMPAPATAIRADLSMTAHWDGGLRFTSGASDGPSIHIDGDSKDGPSPPQILLSALATCTAIDVVLILAKRRTPATTLDVNITAERAEGTPRRITKAHLAYRITGEGIERAHAERAIELGVTKYCTVRDTLDPSMPVLWSLELNGESAASGAIPG